MDIKQTFSASETIDLIQTVWTTGKDEEGRDISRMCDTETDVAPEASFEYTVPCFDNNNHFLFNKLTPSS